MASIKTKKMILDATAFIGLDFPKLLNFDDVIFYTTEGVVAELKDFRSRMNLEVLQQTGNVQIQTPNPELRILIEKEINKIDPHTSLSSTDIDVLVLAQQLEGTLLTNDLTLQNIGFHLNIAINVISGKKVTHLHQWGLICRSCGKKIKNNLTNCPECGGRIKRVSIKTFQQKSLNND
ncbi:MAG: NOB1 family endonuclease [Candidatus Hodarchaeales archaeon]